MNPALFFRRLLVPSVPVVILAAFAPESGAAQGWPQYRGPSANGTTTEKIQTAWPSGGPRELWRTPTTAGFSTFAVANERAFTLVLREVEGVPQEVCIALDAHTGKELWARPLGFAKYDGGGDSGAPGNNGGDGPRSTPATDGQHVFVLSAPLILFSINAENGEIAWKKDLVREHAAKNIAWQNAASPVLEGNLIFVCAGGPGQSLLCFHKATGAVMWKAESDRMTHATPTVATILGNRQVVFLTQSGLVSVIPGTGKVLWRHKFPFQTSTAASPVVDGEIVYCSAGYGVGATAVRISREGAGWKSAELWRRQGDLINHWSTPVCKDGHVYGLFGFKQWQQNPLKCIELATGKEKWSHEGFGQGGTILVDGNVLVLAENGELVLVEGKPNAYRELARHAAVTGKCWNSPAVSMGRAYVRSTKEAVCLDLSVKSADQ